VIFRLPDHALYGLINSQRSTETSFFAKIVKSLERRLVKPYADFCRLRVIGRPAHFLFHFFFFFRDFAAPSSCQSRSPML
jgi:hypothetical protein